MKTFWVSVISLGIIWLVVRGVQALPTQTPAGSAATASPTTGAPEAGLLLAQEAADTPAPSPTVDYGPALTQAAGDVAQAQAESFAYQQAAIDAQKREEALHIEAARITAEAEQRALEGRQLDAANTAAANAITETSIVRTETAAPGVSTLTAAQLTAGAEERAHEAAEPTRATLLLAIEQGRKYGGVDAVTKILTPLALLVLGVVLAFALLYNAAKDRADREADERARVAQVIEPEPAPDPFQNYTPVLIQRYQHIADARLVPCSPEQLTEFSEGVLAGVKSTAIRQWEGAGTLWNRRTYTNFLGWMLRVEVGFATDRGTGTHALTAEGEAFLRAWMDSQALPHSFVFNPDVPPSTVRDARARENHARESGGGDVAVAETEAHDG